MSASRGIKPFSWFVALAAGVGVWVNRRTLLSGAEWAVERVVKARLGGSYRVRVNHVDTLLPARVDDGRHVAVIGGGLAGVAAASALAERGASVVLYEANPFLGGKLASWEHTFEDGTTAPMEHGFHAFFPNYYNLNRFLGRLGIEQRFEDIDDYRVLTSDGGQLSFGDIHKVPILNLFSLWWKGLFTLRELVIFNPRYERLNDLLTFHPDETFAALDDETYAAFAEDARIPRKMRLIFNSFTRAFFARADQMSMAEMIRSFHGYYLSHDGGLRYRYATDDHEIQIWTPIREHLEALGVDIRLGTPVHAIERQKNGRLRVNGRPYDDVVLTAALPAVQSILDASDWVDDEAPDLRDRIGRIQPGNRYANLQVELDRDCREDLPVFTVVEPLRVLDSITTKHRSEHTWRAYVAEHGGSALELHAYSIPDELDTDQAIRDALLEDLFHYLPELKGSTVGREIFYVKKDFPAFYAGMHRHRPGVDSGVDGLWFAGDWVRTELPVMLMEGAFTTGLLAANHVCDRMGVRQAPVYSVPWPGILHGVVPGAGQNG